MFPQSEVAADPTGELVSQLRAIDSQIKELSDAEAAWRREHFISLNGQSVTKPGMQHVREAAKLLNRAGEYNRASARLSARRNEILRELARLKTGIEV